MSEFDPREWPAQEPPADFAERVVAAARGESRSAAEPGSADSRRFTRKAAAGVLLVGSMAAGIALAVHLQARANAGDVSADARREVRVGTRAIAVLEAGAHVKWHGDDIEQAGGDVFWRVEPGARFTVHTAAADVTVKGTCFRVRTSDGEGDMTRRDAMVGAVGAVVGASAFVGVYEGKVAVSHAGQSVDVGAGQSAAADARGVHLTGLAPSAQGSAIAAANAEPDPLLAANANLADTVREYRRRLEAIDADKKKLQKELAEAEAKLGDGGPALAPPDLMHADWKDLAKDGRIRIRLPCHNSKDANYSPANLQRLGLAPQDGSIIANAIAASQKRTWSLLRPLCTQAVGGADVADRIGEKACITLVQDNERESDYPAYAEDIREIGEIMAGERPQPSSDHPLDPYGTMMLALTQEQDKLQGDLTQSLGPDDAQRIVASDEGCWSTQGIGVGPREEQ